MNLFQWAFGKSMTDAERLRKNQRALDRTVRELMKEEKKMKDRTEALKNDIQRSVKAGQMGAARIQAKDLVRTQNYQEKFAGIRSQIHALSLRVQTMSASAQTTNSMKEATRLLGRMNRSTNLPGLQRITMEFEKESDMMEQRQEVIDDAIDDVTGLEDEAESDEIIEKTLADIGIDLKQAMGETPQGLQKNTLAEGRVAQAVGGGGADPGDDDLQARLNSLRR